jgi:hypothetical protein
MVSPERSAVDQEYIEEMWHVMHHADDGDGAMTFLTSYYDDSGSEPLAPITAIGGPVMSRERFKSFDQKWRALLDHYQIFGPLHMADFVRPQGRHIGMYPEMKVSLFSKVSELINHHKLFSISISVPQADFRDRIPKEACKELIGPYSFSFFLRSHDESGPRCQDQR